MKTVTVTDTLNSSIPERIQLVEDIWDTIDIEPDIEIISQQKRYPLSVTDEHLYFRKSRRRTP